MAKKAKRLVSEAVHSLSTVAGSFTLSSLGWHSHFPQGPDLTAPASQRSYSSYARHPLRVLDTILRQGMLPRPKLASGPAASFGSRRPTV